MKLVWFYIGFNLIPSLVKRNKNIYFTCHFFTTNVNSVSYILYIAIK